MGSRPRSIMRATLAVLALVSACHAAPASAPASAPQGSVATQTKLAFSRTKAANFSGGTYKAASTTTFPISKHLAVGLVTLNAGGLREPHWHNPSEWALVLSGTCRAVALEAGKTRPSDLWDYNTGDVWYFGPNVAHSILGLQPSGCRYLAIFDDGSFDERDQSFDLSKWIALLPPGILSQHLNTSVQSLVANLPGVNTSSAAGSAPNVRTSDVDEYLVQGPPDITDASSPALGVQTPLQPHRYALKASTPQVDVKGGGSIVFVDDTLFPIAKNIWGGILRLVPNGLRVSHWHLNSDELQFIANGTDVEIGAVLETGQFVVNDFANGDLGLVPQGAAHYLKNKGNTTADIIVVFNAPVNTGIDLAWTLGAFPASWVAAALNTSTNYTGTLATGYTPLVADIVPASLSVASQ